MGGFASRSRALALSLLAVSALTACSATVGGTGTAGFPKPEPKTSTAPQTNTAPSRLVTLPRLHLRAAFTSTPLQDTLHRTVLAHSIDVHTATVGLDPVTEVAEEDFSPAIPSADIDSVLTGAVGAFASASGMDIDFQNETVFQGHTARTATLTGKAGTNYQLLIFMTNGSRLYIVLAERGAAYDSLTRSIRLLA